ncbi:MAG: ABC transporter permease, partial [Cyanobacteria bacterium P01_F01_bin.42]
MSRYILQRLLQTLPVLLGISLLVFAFLHLIPGDPAVTMLGDRATPEQVEALRDRMGLNQPLAAQYLAFLVGLATFNIGSSIFTGVPVWTELMQRWPATFELSLAAIIIALLLGVPLGILAAVRQNRWIDQWIVGGSVVGVSMPVYWLGLLLIYLFSVTLQWLPSSGRISIEAGAIFQPLTGFFILDALLQLNFSALFDIVRHLMLPAITLSTIPLATVTRITRSAMLEVLEQDYIRTARAKGVAEVWVIAVHGLKNAMLPVSTIVGLEFGTLLGGAILTETIFSWPGVGSWIYDGILQRDYPVVQGGVVFIAVVFVLINL